jgi:hypothetical protein
MDEGGTICPACGEVADPVETDEEYQDRMRGQESDYQAVKNLGLNDH